MGRVRTIGGYEIDDDRERIDRDAVWEFLSTQAYWGRWREREHFEQQVVASWRLVGCYAPDGATVGFARAVSDGVALAYLGDVYVHPHHRGRGLGKAIVAEMVDAGPGRHFRWMLHTRDAHSLYAGFGFAEPGGSTVLERPATH